MGTQHRALQREEVRECRGTFNHKVDGTYEAGRQRWAVQLLNEHVGDTSVIADEM